MYELRTGYWIPGRREMEPSARVHVSTMFSREVTTAEPEIKHTVVAASLYCCCYNCCPRAAELYRGGGTENAADGSKLKKNTLQINLRARNGPLGRISNHSELESLRQFAEV